MANLNPSTSPTRTCVDERRKPSSPLVLRLTSPLPSHSESETEENTSSRFESASGPSHPLLSRKRSGGVVGESLIIVNGKLVPNHQKRYHCTYEGCSKAYTKPSRLEEHERSHTGERPFVCVTCSKSYFRETHLQAHTRSHLPDSDKPFTCVEPGCKRRFWTSQHLRVHGETHKGEKPFKCTEPSCEEAFMKHSQLRTHICEAHSLPGTKPHKCSHLGCAKSFATNQKLRQHQKTHDGKRYTCIHPACLPVQSDSNFQPVYYPTWTALQNHTRTVHPATCPYSSCKGRIFASQKGLRGHIKLHEQSEIEAVLEIASDTDEEGDDEDRPKKRRRGGELGRDWQCEVENCGKDFKSKKALTTHHNVSHLGRRDFTCPYTHCGQDFGYKHLLQRHLLKVHSPAIASESSGEDAQRTDVDTEYVDDLETHAEDGGMTIDDITGNTYAKLARRRLDNSEALRCPHPHLDSALLQDPNSVSASEENTSAGCEYVFTRAYDLRRHMKAEHGVDIEKSKVDRWVAGAKKAQRIFKI